MRSPVRLESHFHREDFPASNAYANARDPVRENVENLDVRIEVFARPYQSRPDEFLITVCLVNRQPAEGRMDLQSLFQSRIEVRLKPGSAGTILPYPTAKPLDSEERSQELLYRDKLTFAVGHGCAADWTRSSATSADSVSAECLPVFETPSTTPDIRTSSGQPLVASMRLLSGIDPGSDGTEQLEAIVSEYEAWIAVAAGPHPRPRRTVARDRRRPHGAMRRSCPAYARWPVAAGKQSRKSGALSNLPTSRWSRSR